MDNLSKLYQGARISKGTRFADTPSVSENGSFMFGSNVDIALSSLPAVAEDQFAASESFVDKHTFRIYETRRFGCGSRMFPLNINDTIDNYKPIPDIGEFVAPNMRLAALRSYDSIMSPVTMTRQATMIADQFSDQSIYLRRGHEFESNGFRGDGRVVDIKVYRNNNVSRNMPEEMSAQFMRYHSAMINYYREILKTYNQFVADHTRLHGSREIIVGDNLQPILVRAMALTNHLASGQAPITLLNRKEPLDEWYVEVTVEYLMKPHFGAKFTDEFGCKGVLGAIYPDEMMPVAKNGVRAQLIGDYAAAVNRMSPGRLYASRMNAANRDTYIRFKQMIGLERYSKAPYSFTANMPQAMFDSAYEYIMGYIEIHAPKQAADFRAFPEETKRLYIHQLINSKADIIKIYYPINNDVHPAKIIYRLRAEEERYGSPRDKVSYIGNSGKRRFTKNNILIGRLYIIPLEKIGDEWGSISYGKLQHFGFLAPMTKADKFSNPWRSSTVRFTGETEWRIIAGVCGRRTIAEIMDRANNPIAQKMIATQLVNSDRPSNINYIVDREVIPYGQHRPLQIFNHTLYCAGMRTVYVPERNLWELQQQFNAYDHRLQQHQIQSVAATDVVFNKPQLLTGENECQCP